MCPKFLHFCPQIYPLLFSQSFYMGVGSFLYPFYLFLFDLYFFIFLSNCVSPLSFLEWLVLNEDGTPNILQVYDILSAYKQTTRIRICLFYVFPT